MSTFYFKMSTFYFKMSTVVKILPKHAFFLCSYPEKKGPPYTVPFALNINQDFGP